ncbi:MAG TPA: 50S ribosomal protein L11 [Bacillota bacterium]|nr:50S ribosomal protein L11 [Bacillota bacterium]
MQIKLLVEGGEMKPGPVLSQKLGPAGIPVNEVIQKVNEATKSFNGLKVPVELEIDTKTREIIVKVLSPPVSELLKKELGAEKGTGDHKQIKVANASIEQIISVSKTKLPDLLGKDLKAAVKTVLGSCISLGVLVENKSPKEIINEIDEGKYDSEISEEKIETSEEKRKELDEHFTKIKEEQEKILKLQAAQAAEAAEAAGEEKPEEKSETKKE